MPAAALALKPEWVGPNYQLACIILGRVVFSTAGWHAYDCTVEPMREIGCYPGLNQAEYVLEERVCHLFRS